MALVATDMIADFKTRLVTVSAVSDLADRLIATDYRLPPSAQGTSARSRRQQLRTWMTEGLEDPNRPKRSLARRVQAS